MMVAVALDPILLDKKDLAILRALQHDGRLSNVALADAVALTPTPCARRVRRLEAAGVLRGYVGLVDPVALGLRVTAFTKLRLISERRPEVESFEDSVLDFPEVMECYAMAGGYDYLLKVVAEDLSAYHHFLRSKLLRIRAVDHVETNFVLNAVVARTELPLARSVRRLHVAPP